MRFMIGCILGLAALAPFAILAARALSVPIPPTQLVVAAVDSRDCKRDNSVYGKPCERPALPINR